MDNKKTSIKERVLQIAQNKGIGYVKFLNSVGASYSNFKGKQKKTALSSDTIDKIITKYPDTNLHWLITGENVSEWDAPSSSMTLNEDPAPYNNRQRLSLETKPPTYTLFDKESIAAMLHRSIPTTQGKIANATEDSVFTIVQKESKPHYVIPAFQHKHIDFMLEVDGISMNPEYNSGDVLACTVLNEYRFLQWNKVHVVVTHTQGIMVKRIHQGTAGTLKMVSNHPDYPPFEVPKEAIRGIALVVGVVRVE